MGNYVAYHNPSSMGYKASEIDTSEGFRILTNKTRHNLIGSRVWLVTGEGSPKQYSLVYNFIIDKVTENIDGFRYEISGKKGNLFKPSIPLTHYHWFLNLKKTQGNFGLGFNSINNVEIVNGLESLL